MKRRRLPALVTMATLFVAGSARADLEPLIRIGDKDGFGYGSAPGFRAANRGPANLDGLGILGNGDYLPDVNRDGHVQYGSHDDFDLRSSGEIAQKSVFAGSNVTNFGGTTGSQWTDISLSRSYDASSSVGQVLTGGNPVDGLRFGAGGPFPDGASRIPNEPSFLFQFDVAKTALNANAGIYFNLIFGDYDVTPAAIRLTLADHSTKLINLRTQGANRDGLIQAAQADLAFDDVFRDGGSLWNGMLRVDFIAPNEPYTAFDYVELSTFPILSVPEPSSVVTLGIGLGVGVLGAAVRRRSARPWFRFRSE